MPPTTQSEICTTLTLAISMGYDNKPMASRQDPTSQMIPDDDVCIYACIYIYIRVYHSILYFRCECGECGLMPTLEESVCCCEIERVQAKKERDPEVVVRCITELEGFGAVCLNSDVLETAYYQYREQYGHMPEANDNNP
jgi:hypothetical protein